MSSPLSSSTLQKCSPRILCSQRAAWTQKVAKRCQHHHSPLIAGLLVRLRQLDTASLCSAAKAQGVSCATFTLLDEAIRPMTNSDKTMAGVVRTVQCAQPNDFLAVLRGLSQAVEDDVLVINACDDASTRAVAGELMCAEAQRRGLAGLVIDGPMRDIRHLSHYSAVRCFARSVTPYPGSSQHLGYDQVRIYCGGIQVEPGWLMVGDDDGVVVADANTFDSLVADAQDIKDSEDFIKVNIANDKKSLFDMLNFDEHVLAVQEGRDSTLKFRS